MFENLILPANVPPIITPISPFAYFRSEKDLPFVVLSNQFVEGSLEM